MRSFTIILFSIVTLSSCDQDESQIKGQNTRTIDAFESRDKQEKNLSDRFQEINSSTFKIISDKSNLNKGQEIIEQTTIKKDSTLLVDYNLFKEVGLVLNEISKTQFNAYLTNEQSECQMSDFGIIEESECNEICETYLIDSVSKKRMLMPSDYDAGIIGILLSSNCHQLIVYSSYDGPDYDDYYMNRAEFYLFKMDKNKGLDGVQPFLKYSTKHWSIEDIAWVNDKKIALKLYHEQRWGDGSGLNYKYFQASFVNKRK